MAKNEDKQDIINVDETPDYEVSQVSDLKDEDILSNMMSNFNDCETYYSELYLAMKEDYDFLKGDQWPTDVRQARVDDGKPVETYNQLGQFVKKVVNSAKMNPPSINIKKGDFNANQETTEFYQAKIKQIESESDADNSYLTAFHHAASGGIGFIRLNLVYEDEMSFEQSIRIEPIDDPFAVYIDPNFKSDYSDLNYAIVYTTMSKDEFEQNYPDAESCSANWQGFIDNKWVTKDSIRIVEYFFKSYHKEWLYKCEGVDNGILKSDYDKLENKPKILKKRQTVKETINWIKCSKDEILERTTFPGKDIPVIPVLGDTFVVEGKRYFEGIIRQAKSSQRTSNYVNSTSLEMLGMMAKGKIVIPAGSIEGYEEEWYNMHLSNDPVLPYNQKDLQGNSSQPTPLQQSFPMDVIAQMVEQSANGMKATTGIYDPSLGKEGGQEVSGIALLTKQRQAETINFMYVDSLSKSLTRIGKILVNIIPIVYGPDAQVIIKSQSGEDRVVKASDSLEINLNKGKYNVEVTIGPYGETQRQETARSMLAFMNAIPESAPLLADKFAAAQDWKDADVIAKRLQTQLPDNIKAMENGEQEQTIPPAMQQQIEQAQADYENQIAELSASLQNQQLLASNLLSELNQQKQSNVNKLMEIESKEKIEAEKNRNAIILKLIDKGMPVSDPMLADVLNQYNQQIIENDASNIPPQMGDTVVVAGMNDPNTIASQQSSIDNQINQMADQQQEPQADDRDRILQGLDQNFSGIPRVTTGNR